MLWDLNETRPNPLIRFPDDSVSASVYSLATIPTGQILATGSPAQAIGLYDPRLCSQVAKLVGHTDNIRSILISDDGRRLLSASSDATVKMWDVRMQRCSHTFSHHSTSVWALHSQHPQLQVFHSGDRSGWLCKVDLEGSDDFGEGQCVVLCQVGRQDDQVSVSCSSKPINESIVRIVALDDTFVWTATGSSTVQRWRDVPTRHQRRQVAGSKARFDPIDLTSIPNSLNPSDPTITASPPARAPTDPIPSPSLRSPQSVSFNLAPTPSPKNVPRASSLPISVNGESQKSPQSSIIQPTTKPSSRISQSSQVNRPVVLDGIPLESLVPLFSHLDHLLQNSERQDLESLTIHPTFSLSSDPCLNHRPQEAHLNSPGMIRSLPSCQLEPIQVFSPMTIESKFDNLHTPTILNPYPQSSIIDTTAWKLYTIRDSAAEAIPLRDSPDDLIPGCSGLIKCELLNDRRHVITLDTVGRLALWDIICCTCKGIFDAHDLELDADQASSNGSAPSLSSFPPGELLKLVKARIEGQATIATWCTVEIRTGLLTVHLDENKCFEGEVYADEAGLSNELLKQMKEDHRIFLGKWILRNLFDGFVNHQHRLRNPSPKTSSPYNPTSVTSSGRHGASQAGNETGLDGRKASLTNQGNSAGIHQSGVSVKGFATRTPGMTIALATPALTPVILPDVNHPVGMNGHLKNVQGSDAGFASSDYFSLPRLVETDEEKLSPERVTPVGLDSSTDAGSSYGSSLNPPHSPKQFCPTPPSFEGASVSKDDRGPANETTGANGGYSSIPGNSAIDTLPVNAANIFTRFRSFGRGPKRRNSHDPVAPPVISNPMPCREFMNGVRSESDFQQKNLSERIKAQQQVVQMVLSRPFAPCGELDAPKLSLPSETTILISEEQVESGAWEVSYRGLVSTTDSDYEMLMKVMPAWLLDFLFGNRPMTGGSGGPVHKITFVLQPEGGKEVAGLPELPNGNARLTASRVLRMKKVAAYVLQKLELSTSSAFQPSSPSSKSTETPTNHPSNSKSIAARVSSGSATNPTNLPRPDSSSPTSRPPSSSHSIDQRHNLTRHQHHPTRSDESNPTCPSSPKNSNQRSSDQPVISDRSIQLSCNGQPLHRSLTLGVVKQWFWARAGDVTIHYRLKRT